MSVVGRITAHQAAMTFGRYVGNAFEELGVSGFTDKESQDEFFNHPDLVSLLTTSQYLSFLGGGYNQRMNELKSGIIYLGNEANLPEEERLKNPPEFEYLEMKPKGKGLSDLSDCGGNMIIQYRLRLWKPVSRTNTGWTTF